MKTTKETEQLFFKPIDTSTKDMHNIEGKEMVKTRLPTKNTSYD